MNPVGQLQLMLSQILVTLVVMEERKSDSIITRTQVLKYMGCVKLISYEKLKNLADVVIN